MKKLKQVEVSEKVAKNTREWWVLVQNDRTDWNEEVDEDDQMSILDFAESLGTIYGYWYDSSNECLIKVN